MTYRAMKTEFLDLGCKGYREVWAYQEKRLAAMVRAKVAGESVGGQVLFVEHPPVYTIGKSGHAANMLLNEAQLAARQVECIPVDRGGDITFHGPGQLVIYPLLDLDRLQIGVKEYVHRLEETVIRMLADYGIRGERVAGATGVWLDKDTPQERKICAIGVKCSRSITMHGLALNVNTDLSYFNNINPCGFVDKGVTSIAREVGHPVDFAEAKERMRAQFRRVVLNGSSQENE